MNQPRNFNSTPAFMAFNAGQRDMLRKGVSPQEITETPTTDIVKEGYKRAGKLAAGVVAGAVALGGAAEVVSISLDRQAEADRQQMQNQEVYPSDHQIAEMAGGTVAEQPKPTDIHPVGK